jgi:predicted ester cyclase
MSPKRLIERFYNEVWNRADEVVAHEILHSEFCFRGSLGEEKRGSDGFITYLRMIHTVLSKYTCTIDEIVEEGQRAAARMRFAGIHRGQFFGVAPSGREISWSGAAFFAIDGDKIISLWVLGDIDSVKQQLGMHGPAVPKGRFTS